MREDELTTILQAGTTSVAEAVRPKPPEAVRARGDQRRRHQRLGSALLALAVLAAAGGVYAGVHTGTGAMPPNTHPTIAPSEQVATGAPVPTRNDTAPPGSMLPAGQVGTRAQIPWSSVDTSWTMTEFSSGTVDQSGNWRDGGGQLTLSLVDPEGGRYVIYRQSGTGQPWTLLAWSNFGTDALLGVGSPDAAGRYPGYRVIPVEPGSTTAFAAPTDVTPVGFAFSDTGLLAVRRTATQVELQRYSLSGKWQATLASEDVPPGAAPASYCGHGCPAVIEPAGATVAWNDGTGLRLVSAYGSHFSLMKTTLTVPGAGSNCIPLRWWDDQTVLASCGSGSRARLWLTRWDGQQATPLTPPGSPASANGPYAGAWRLDGTLYVNRSAGATCQGTAGGPAASGFYSVGRDGALHPQEVAGSSQANVSGTAGNSLLVLASTGCPGGTGLMAYDINAAAPTTTWLQRAPSWQAGVVAAASFQY